MEVSRYATRRTSWVSAPGPCAMGSPSPIRRWRRTSRSHRATRSSAITPYNTPNPGTVTLKNSGTGPATIASITASGDFTVEHNCGTSLAVNATCLANVTFKPTDLYARTGTLTVNADTVFTTTLSGTGGLAASISAKPPDGVKEGKSVTLTWSSSPHAVCEGVGGTPGWAGPLMQSGSRDVTSDEAGTFEYGIRCTDDAQILPAVQASARVYFFNVASGALDWSLLLALTFALGLVLRARIAARVRRNDRSSKQICKATKNSPLRVRIRQSKRITGRDGTDARRKNRVVYVSAFPHRARCQPLHVAQRDRLPQRRQRIARGYEFVRHVAGKAGVGDGLRDRAPVQLLGVVDLVAAGVRRRCGSGRSTRGCPRIVRITSPSMICMW